MFKIILFISLNLSLFANNFQEKVNISSNMLEDNRQSYKARVYFFADRGVEIFKEFKICTIKAKTGAKIKDCENKLRKDLEVLDKESEKIKKNFVKNNKS